MMRVAIIVLSGNSAAPTSKKVGVKTVTPAPITTMARPPGHPAPERLDQSHARNRNRSAKARLTAQALEGAVSPLSGALPGSGGTHEEGT